MCKEIVTMAYGDHLYLNKRDIKNIFIPPLLPEVGNHLREKNAQLTIGVLGDLSEESSGGGFDQFVFGILPVILKKIPEAHIRISGKGMTQPCRDTLLHLPNVLYAEYTDNIEDFWNGIDILAVPILIDRGIRIRILESVMRNIPVVCNRQASTGFADPEIMLCIAEDFNNFANLCISLLSNPVFYKTQKTKIDEYVKKNLSKGAIEYQWANEFIV